MGKLSKAIMVLGGAIFVTAGCALDSPGSAGYIAGAVAIVGGIIFNLHALVERRDYAD